MATSTEAIRADYPLPVYNYRVEINGVSFAFSEVSGLSIGYEITTYKESPTAATPGPRTMHMPAQVTPPTITLKKGLVAGKSLSTLYGWIQTVATNQIEKRDISVRLCDEKGVPLITWRILNAFPTKLTAPTFDAKSNDVAIETMELKADAITMEGA
ncbi:MAG: phage tail protein [Cyanobacteria bacterium K_Offshore_surface_m2_239]|nr:phage tail protein [Cyanobacteria bacterium K_Offshore_surface_m2_239]